MDTLLSIAIGIGLSAACGFRIFVPPLVMSMAALFGHLPLAPNFEWMGTYPALLTFAIATCVEIAAYYIPWIDNLLDIVSTPTAIAVGTFLTAAIIPHDDPLVQWTIAVIAGGGSAGIVQALTGMVRFSSTALTGGFGNGVVSTLEAGSAIILSILAIWLPVVTVALVISCGILLWRKGYLRLPNPRES
ncbi:DUF4126 domain-containing protein [Coleofasciculus sp. FACHB-64]|uniref:DUF4126 domain-containing protein n=1 Tax=Cyanophyceae TaxID=3028117 RepID=UPI0016860DC2|nr:MULTISPECIES: DUF4126 domain-containing protein [unclassified Coleofasciculus]MBD1837552.1 DUF4126 domain-containing protein [Coleofasciculus sp. FACHB-501]MBD2047205.1 DUF4126 domain-containing protein [Coleofasciculus sp. FACHB-64]MBD2086653.1 DUF4126 domain-containing protein [Coleofasciculus sp. FACHB-542]